MSAMIIAEIGSFKHFVSYDKILVSPSTHQSEQLDSTAHPEKPCPRYLRYVLYNVAKYAAVGIRHLPNIYPRNVLKANSIMSLFHTLSKLVRGIYHLEKSEQQNIKAA